MASTSLQIGVNYATPTASVVLSSHTSVKEYLFQATLKSGEEFLLPANRKFVTVKIDPKNHPLDFLENLMESSKEMLSSLFQHVCIQLGQKR